MKIAGFAAGALLIAASASAQEDAARRAVEVAARMPFEKAVKVTGVVSEKDERKWIEATEITEVKP